MPTTVCASLLSVLSNFATPKSPSLTSPACHGWGAVAVRERRTLALGSNAARREYAGTRGGGTWRGVGRGRLVGPEREEGVEDGTVTSRYKREEGKSHAARRSPRLGAMWCSGVHTHRAHLCEKDVGRLEVAVEHGQIVDVLERVTQLVGPRDHPTRRERLASRRPLLDGCLERAAVGKLHENKELSGKGGDRGW